MSYSRSSYSSSSSYGRPSPAMASMMNKSQPSPPPAARSSGNNATLVVSTDLNTISSFQMIRGWMQDVIQERGMTMKDSEVEARALRAWHPWSSAWREKSAGAVEYVWNADSNIIEHQLQN